MELYSGFEFYLYKDRRKGKKEQENFGTLMDIKRILLVFKPSNIADNFELDVLEAQKEPFYINKCLNSQMIYHFRIRTA